MAEHPQQYGKEIISFETSSDGIIARFADGSSATGTILIGCDGSKSRVRELAFDHDPAGQAMDSGGRVINFTTTFPEALARKLRSEGAPINICGHPDFDLCYYVACKSNLPSTQFHVFNQGYHLLVVLLARIN